MTMFNKTLNALAAKATEYVESQPRHMASSLWEIKFAELIVKECIDIASQTHTTEKGSMRCANDDESVRLIKERFGVE